MYKISSKEYQERYPEKLEILNKDFNRGENIKKSNMSIEEIMYKLNGIG